VAIAGGVEHLAGQEEHVGLQIGIGPGYLPRRDLSTERRRGLDRERVRRDVLGSEGNRFVQGAPPGLERLSIRAVDQVEAQVAEPRPSRGGDRRADGRGLVDPFQ
jgi:hypothetical protein